MAYVRTHHTQLRRRGKVVKTYAVCWLEQATDTNGLPIPSKMRARQESYPTREAAEVRRDELNAAKHMPAGTAALADARKAGALTFGHYAGAWLAANTTRVRNHTLKQSTADSYADIVRAHLQPTFGATAIAAVTSVRCEAFHAGLVTQELASHTVRNIWAVLRHVLTYAVRHQAIAANPADVLDRPPSLGGSRFEHCPLTGPQVALLATQVGERSHPVYGLLVLFLAYTGLRAAEVQGLEVRDLMLSTGPDGATKGSVRVVRTKDRKGGAWVTGTPKTKRSVRTVPLPGWLAERMADYLATEHERAGEPTAPLWAASRPGGARTKGAHARARLDYTRPVDTRTFATRVLTPALAEAGLPHCRLHDLRHTAAALWLTAGVHFMQVSKWLGHASYVVTMTVYADWMPDEEAANPLPEPVAPPAGQAPNVVNLFGRQSI